ncbi:MAG TPA: hypothetical protein VMZ90_02015 [Vicinamibacterales bacterium]|nr:hypothetical protein [Vicinamibacterales bacterium]
MARSKIAVTTLALVLGFGFLAARNALQAQTAVRGDTGEVAVAALVSEIRALRAEMAAASRNQLRAQILLGRVQMQEQRLAYLDKQRSDAATQAAQLAAMTVGLRDQVKGFQGNGCANMPNAEAKRDCEGMSATLQRQLAAQDASEQELRSHERDLENALSGEQARWSEFNARLDELERALR